MTYQEKAESCGEFVRDGLDVLRSGHPQWCACGNCDGVRNAVILAARQAGHWGRLALNSYSPPERLCRVCNRLAVINGLCVQCSLIQNKRRQPGALAGTRSITR